MRIYILYYGKSLPGIQDNGATSQLLSVLCQLGMLEVYSLLPILIEFLAHVHTAAG